jgi:glycosyltransferase involved in cell wall biosynthesis
MEFKLLSILIPAYNERRTLESLVAEVLNAGLPEGMERELVIVNDCSTDGTGELLDAVAARHPGVIRAFHQPFNQGKGAAITRALKEARGDICIIQDADMEYDPGEYPRILRPILDGNADVVYGSRFRSSEYARVLYFWHSMGNRFLTVLSNMFTNLNLTDMETCYKAAKSSVFRSIPIRSRRFGLEPEMTAKFAKHRCRIYEVPISYRGRTYLEGKKITWRDGLKALFTIVWFRLVDDLYNEETGRDLLFRFDRSPKYCVWLARRVHRALGDRVLEARAGLANYSLFFLPRARYAATDPDPRNLRFLENRLAGIRGAEVLEWDPARGDRPPAGEVDTVLCLRGLAQAPDDAAALRAMAACLPVGGRLVLAVPRGRWLFGPLDQELGRRRRYTKREVLDRLAAAGFEAERTEPFNKAGVLWWLLNGVLLRRRRIGRWQLKLFDIFIWLFRRLDGLLPWPGLTLLVTARKR